MSEKLIKCLVCGASEGRIRGVSHPFYKHEDAELMNPQPKAIGECGNCGAIFMPDAAVRSSLPGMYEGADYAATRKTNHVVYGAGGGLQGTHARMAALIKERVPSGSPRILDLGSFDGKLLVELQKLYDGMIGHGFDVSEHIGALFPTSESLSFFHGKLSDLPGRYDIVSIVNVLMYVDTPWKLMSDVRKLLAPGGILFVTSPNIAKNPWSLLLGDQAVYFTAENLERYLHIFGFSVDGATGSDAFPRNNVVFARQSGTSPVQANEPGFLDRAIDYLDTAKAKALAAEQNHRASGRGGRLTVLGGTVNASWAADTLGRRIDCFVDENPNRVGRMLRGLPIRHPSDLDDKDLVLLPYGATAEPIRQRLSQRYRMQMVTL